MLQVSRFLSMKYTFQSIMPRFYAIKMTYGRQLNIQSWSKRYRSAHNKLGRTAQLQTCFNIDSGEMGALNKINLFNCTMLPLSFLTVPSIPVSVSEMLA